MDFSLDERSRLLLAGLDPAFAGVAARAAGADETGAIPEENWQDVLASGYPRIFHRPAAGGRGGPDGPGVDGATQVLAMEALARACPSTFWSVTMSTLVCAKLVARHGDPAVHGPLVEDLLSGRRRACFAVVELGAGSDAAGYATTAHSDGDAFAVSGEKARITNATTADLAVTLARLGTVDADGTAARWCYAFIDLRQPGVRSFPLPHLGLRAMPWGSLVFQEARVDARDVVPIALDQFPEDMAWGWLFISVAAIAIAQAALDRSVEHVTTRTAFGRPLAHLESVRASLAEMRTQIDAARLLALRVGWHRAEGRPVQDLAGMLKPFATETAVRVLDRAVQLHGSWGLTPGHPVERWYRDAPMNVIGGFASNRLREVTAAELGLEARYRDFDWLEPTGLATDPPPLRAADPRPEGWDR